MAAGDKKWEKGDTRVSGGWRQVWNGKKWVSTRKVGGGGGASSGSAPRPTVVGPYDRPYLTDRQIAREARIRAGESVETPESIAKRYEVEETGARAIGESFEQMLARQAARNLAAQQAIQGAAGGAGSALTTGAVTGTTQAQAGVPLFAAGETVRLQRDVAGRRSEAEKQRAEDYRKNVAAFRESLRGEEKEKQAARIERAAAAQAYNIDLAQLNAAERKEAQRQSNWERNYQLAAQREQRLANADTGNINDLISTIDDIAKEASVRKGAGGWQGTISYIDPETSERESMDISGVQFDPKGKTVQQRQSFWRNYVARAIGANAADITSVGTGALARGEGRAPAGEVAKQLIDAVMAQGYSRRDAVAAILRTVWGGANAKAVQAAARG